MAPPGPKKQFSEQEALDSLVLAFWQSGYETLNYDNLVKTSGVNRHSLYTTFGDKRRLFIHSLQHYVQTTMNRVLAPLLRPEADREALCHYFDNLKKAVLDETLPDGCLVCQTITTPLIQDEEIAQATAKLFERLRALFRRALLNDKPLHFQINDVVTPYVDDMIGWAVSISTMAKHPALRPIIPDFTDRCVQQIRQW